MTADFEKIHAFAEKWIAEFRAGHFFVVEEQMGPECAGLGFLMDCGESLRKDFPDAMMDHENLARHIHEINDFSILGNAIYSQWRYYQHWASSDWDTAWFYLALNRLDRLAIRESNLSKNAELLYENIRISGTFAISDRTFVLSGIRTGMTLELIREPENPHDKNAVSVRGNYSNLGYIPRKIAAEIAPQMDENCCLFAVVSGIDRDDDEIFADIYRRKLIPLDGITNFSYRVDGGFRPWPPEVWRCKLSIRQRKFVSEILVEKTEVRYFEIVFTEKEWKPLYEKLQKCNFLAWLNDYHETEPVACDARWWTLSVRMKGRHVFRSSGDIHFPEEWSIFQSLLSDCRDLSQIKGNGFFRVIPWEKYQQEKRKRKKKNEQK